MRSTLISTPLVALVAASPFALSGCSESTTAARDSQHLKIGLVSIRDLAANREVRPERQAALDAEVAAAQGRIDRLSKDIERMKKEFTDVGAGAADVRCRFP